MNPLHVGGRYGKLGWEVCDSAGAVAIVHRVASDRLAFLDEIRNQKAARGEPAFLAEEEAKKLEARSDGYELAHLFAAAPELLSLVEMMLPTIREMAASLREGHTKPGTSGEIDSYDVAHEIFVLEELTRRGEAVLACVGVAP